MYEFKSLARLTMIASVLVAIHALVDVLAATATVMFGPPGPDQYKAVDWLQVVSFLLLIACVIAVARWIYRASQNAHTLGREMTITPGWAVGWYFVPFANLVKPFHAMREIWTASHETDGSYEERVPILILWWGLWITTNILSNVAWRLGDPGVGAAISLVTACLGIALSVVLIMIMREVESSQLYTRHELTFA